MSSAVVDCDCYFSREAVDEDRLTLQLSYEVGGEEGVVDVGVAASFKSAVTGGFSLRDI